jgi:hypothetical protein
MSKKKQQENSATPKFALTDLKPVDVVDSTNKVSSVIKAHPDYATHPEVQGAVTKWVSAAALIAGYEQQLASLHAQITAIGGERDTAVTSWKRTTRTVLSTIDAVAAGSPQSITQWGFEVAQRVVQPVSTAPPENLRVGYTKAHAFVIRWKAVQNQRGYLLQIGDGTPTGWGANISATKVTYEPTGLTSGQHIAIRVAVVRKNGVSAWSDVLSAMYR